MSDKIRIPDGNGGWKEIDAVRMGAKTSVDEAKQGKALQEQFHVDAGTLTEKLGRFASTYCRDYGLTPEHLAFAVSLLCINIREDFPAGNGGSEGFDMMSAAAAEYYDNNVPRTKS